MQGPPFGSYPSFGEYLEWAQQQGCHVEHGERYGVLMVKITAPDGSRSVIEFGMSLEERMPPTQVWHYDRNLKLLSPWPSFDPENWNWSDE